MSVMRMLEMRQCARQLAETIDKLPPKPDRESIQDCLGMIGFLKQNLERDD